MNHDSVEPISPDNIQVTSSIPGFVFKAFNDLITRNMNHATGVSKVLQEDVVNELVANHGCDKKEIYAKGWLNIEDRYRRIGWIVVYDKPTFADFYKPYFHFAKPTPPEK